jgi:hypothetical protein
MNARALALLVVLTALVVATQASAKEGIVAQVVTPISRDAAPGTKVNVVWTLMSVEDEDPHPFSADGVFIRLFGPAGSHTKRVYATQIASGRFRATLRIPRGGVRRIAIGLMGERCDAEGCGPSPILFRIAEGAVR